jgi:gliding motility-associated-like protein
VHKLELSIFNRWGECVFHSGDKNARWDGNYLGLPCPAGVYYYKVNFSAANGVEKSISGNLVLFR